MFLDVDVRMKIYLFGEAIVVLALLASVLLRSAKSRVMSVRFTGWKNVPPPASVDQMVRRYGIVVKGPGASRSGDCAVLAITNNDSRYLAFREVSVDYQSGTGWTSIVPTNWPWFRGLLWTPGGGRAMDVPRPAEVPASASWRIHFVCYIDKEGLSRGSLRIRLNQLASRILKRETLLFYRPIYLGTPDIPPKDSNRVAN